jgi:hypothetical protein
MASKRARGRTVKSKSCADDAENYYGVGIVEG